MPFQVTQFEYHQRQGVGIGGAWKNEPIWVAVVELQGPTGTHQLSFSRFDSETEWYCDSHFGPGSYPYFCHGEGSRSCLKKTAQDPLRAELNRRKAAHSGELVEVYGVA